MIKLDKGGISNWDDEGSISIRRCENIIIRKLRHEYSPLLGRSRSTSQGKYRLLRLSPERVNPSFLGRDAAFFRPSAREGSVDEGEDAARFRRSPLLHRGLLESVQMGVEAIRSDQVVVGAHLRDGSLLQDADHVGVSYRRQPMSYGDAGPAFHRFVQGSLHHL